MCAASRKLLLFSGLVGTALALAVPPAAPRGLEIFPAAVTNGWVWPAGMTNTWFYGGPR